MDRVVIALGGNTLVEAGENSGEERQLQRLQETMDNLKEIIRNNSTVLTHGNGPQVGNLLIQQDKGKEEVPPLSLDTCVAMTQGQIGYYIERSTDVNTVAVNTQVEVDPEDPAFEDSSKPIGPYYEEKPEKEEKEFVEEPEGWRRVVPSPEPKKIIEIKEIKSLLERGFNIVACGGGGIPVKRESERRFKGIEAVVDKDKASALLGDQLNADKLYIITDVPYVYRDYGTENQERIENMHPAEARELIEENEFEEGSMKPKIESVIRFLSSGGEKAVITDIENAEDINKDKGTIIKK